MTDVDKRSGLAADQVRLVIDPETLDFDTTDDLEDLAEVIGQPRAVAAMEFGTGIEQEGYNIFALGPAGSGKRQVIREYFKTRSDDQPVPDEWCYVNNFTEQHKPKAIRLPPGKAVEFRSDMDELIEGLSTALSAAFESEEYQSRRRTIAEEFQERQSQAFHKLQEQAEEHGVALLRTPSGFVFAPVKDGEVLSAEEAKELPDEEKERLEEAVEQLQEELQGALQQMPSWQRDTQEKLKELNKEIAELAVSGLIGELRRTYEEYEPVVGHLDAVQTDIVENAEDFLQTQEEESALPAMLRAAQGAGGESSLSRRYRVNVLVERSDSKGAPVVYEDNPTYQNLVGRVEHRAQMGALVTDFNLIKPGALHEANGGYLILEARKLLTQPYAWEGLKRALTSGEVRIDSLGQMLSLVSTVSLEPQPIPLSVKVALYGEPLLYYMLRQYDADFADLFKVQADFSEVMDRSPESQELYARLVATMVRREGLSPFDRAAVARVIEHSSRSAASTDKLSALTRDTADLLREASYWAKAGGNAIVTREDVQEALDAWTFRSDRIRERMQESITDDVVLIATDGQEVGQVNGLSVIQLGGFMFGRPSRITARTRLGKGDVVDIEREVELGGPLHSKGVMILAGFLGGRYASDQPLSLSASLVFEQSYGGVDGDSASSAELYALMSAIAEVPLKQSLAVTGSVNQHGVVQAIGGVNEKIEGFFDICNERGLTGDQGVLIPAANVKHLMLRDDVVSAVAEGRFNVYPVETIDEGIELLTDLPAGVPDADGEYPDGTVNSLIKKRLAEIAEKRRQLARQAEAEE